MAPITSAVPMAGRALSEDRVKDILRSYGINTPKYCLVSSAAEVDRADLTFPVVIKVCSPDILHKTDVGGVRLNVPDRAALETALREMRARFPLTPFLVEPMEPSGLEVIIGLVNDATFGQCIMVGLGGIFAEVLQDVAFRALPIDRAEADSMLRDLRAHKVLEGYRGSKVDREALVDLLVNVSRMGSERRAEIDQLDLNPVILHENGLCVVDAKLIRPGEPGTPARSELHPPEALRPILYPDSVAVIGASANPVKFGGLVMRNLVEGKYAGHIYPINPHSDVIHGRRVYKSILDVPEPVDLALIVVPVEHVFQAVKECGDKGVTSVAICAGGFDELGPEGAAKGKELERLLSRYPMRAVGPNQMGVINMNNGCWAAFAIEALTSRFRKGSMGVIVQSGSVGSAFLEHGCYDELGFSLYMPLGNRMDTDEADWIHFMDADPTVNVVCVELEGIKNGQRFLRAIRSAKKPIVAMKTGRTSYGHKAAASHSAALATNERVVAGVLKQHGVYQADSIQELYDVSKTLAMLGPIQGNRLLTIETSGGLGIIACDEAEQAGVELPEVSDESKAVLRKILPPHAVIRNWIDIVSMDPDTFIKIAGTRVMKDYDALLLIFGDPVVRAGEIVAAFKRTSDGKPIMVAFSGGGEVEEQEWGRIMAQGVPVFPSVERAMTYFRLRPNKPAAGS